MFGVTRAPTSRSAPSYNDSAHRNMNRSLGCRLQRSVVAIIHAAEIQFPTCQSANPAKPIRFVTGEQVKYRDPRKGIIRANRIVMNNLPDGIKQIRITENDLTCRVTTETKSPA
ncbi:hypothetical protein ACNKHL_25145 [Shigella flexneri]